jgi:hemerythrin-like domain-containing protein
MSAPSVVPDVTEMIAVHRVFRGGFDMGPRLIASAGDSDSARVAVVASYFRNLLEFLHVHHGGEDELVFPRLMERTDQTAGIEALVEQHERSDAAAAGAQSALEQWAASASATDRQAFADAWAELGDVLTSHMDQEEAFALPLIEEHLTLEEWQPLPGHAMGNFKGDNLFLILGLVRDQMTQDQRDRMLEGMPPPAADAWCNVGVNAYAQTVRELMASGQ